MQLSLIAAVARNGAIGKDNALLWRLPQDLQFFKRTTLGCPVIMGRKTFESIGKPLPGRRNIVITRNANWVAAGVESAASLEIALALVQEVDKAFVIGGAQIYEQALPLADEIILTEIGRDFEADTFFPDWDRAAYKEITRETHRADAPLDCDYAFVTYQRLAMAEHQPAFQLRWAQAQDAGVVANLVHQLLDEVSARAGFEAFSVDEATSEQTVRRWLEQGHYQALLAYDGDKPVGVATIAQSFALYAGGPIGIIQEFFVESPLRSSGLGAQLLDRIGDLARRRNWSALELCTPPLPEFDKTLAFYRRHGFQPVGGRKMRRSF